MGNVVLFRDGGSRITWLVGGVVLGQKEMRFFPVILMAKFMKFFLNYVRDGAEAIDVCVQDPPKSDVDLEGA